MIEISLRDMADEYDQPVPASHGGLRTKWPEEREGIIDTAVMREAADEIDRLRAALECLVLDVQDYPAWQRPCAALAAAQNALTKSKGA